MIMRQGQQLLLPAKPVFIWGSLFAALVINMALNMGLWGRAAWVPDVLAVCLVFWCVHQPQRIGVGTGFFFGLLMDVHQSALLGQHALAYTLMAFGAIAMHRRLLWFALSQQAAQVFPLMLVGVLVQMLIRLVRDAGFPQWGIWLTPALEALMWPALSLILLAPQRRAPDPDEDRPL